APPRGVVFTEDVAKIADQQSRYTVGHRLSPSGINCVGAWQDHNASVLRSPSYRETVEWLRARQRAEFSEIPIYRTLRSDGGRERGKRWRSWLRIPPKSA